MRPLLRPEWPDLPGDPDPADRTMVAHATAAAVLRVGRDSGVDPERTRRLIGLADDVGLDDIAALWRDAGAGTLPGTLWSLYLLRTWVHRDGAVAARLFAAGQRVAEVSTVVAGVAEPPGPREVAELGDAVLTSAFDGDFAVALERAAAFCRVVAAGRAHLADDCEDESESVRQTRLADGNLRMAQELEHAASLWRQNELS
ncbi:MAG: hypothetical protein ICV70_07380 [Jiangellaceae bacterium]|nr:hypothetical protein [Jiangellaceae bacterium]